MGPFFIQCQKIFTEAQPPELAKSTLRTKGHHITLLLNYLESKNIKDFTDFEIGKIYEFITSLSFASQTISAVQFSIREFFDILYKAGVSSIDGRHIFPVIFTNKRDRIISYYQSEEVQKLINAIDICMPDGVRDKCMVLLAAQTGLRESDIIQLTFDEIKWDKDIISKKQQKTKLCVQVPLPRNLKLLLLDYIKNYRPESNENYVFICSETHSRYCNAELYFVVRKYFLKAEIDIGNRRHGPHSLRHSLASNLLKNNTPMPVITGILGHKNLNTTSKYLSIDVESLRECCLEVPYV